MSRLRNAFRRQDSFSASTAPALPAQGSPGAALDDEIELKKLDDDGDPLPHRYLPEGKSSRVGGEEDEGEDAAILDVDQLRAADKLASGTERPIETAEDWGTRLLSTQDFDVNVHNLRMYILGLGMTCFAACLGQIFYFRPSSLTVSSLFIVCISHILGTLWHVLLPKAERGGVWRLLNPNSFNIKEHVSILIMATTAFSSAQAINVFAADELYYDLNPNYGQAIFTMIGSQFFGYGLAGLCRSVLVFPSIAIWPQVVPTVQLFDLLHRDTAVKVQKKRLKFFLIIAVAIFAWSFFPEFIAPTLTGVSIFCLARQNSTWVTRIFGGSYPNEGMGLFQFCFDWTYISGLGSLYTPLETSMGIYAGMAICALVTCVCYAKNVWKAQNFPFLAQDLYYEDGTLYDQTAILDANYNLNETLLAEQGLPYMTTSYALYYLGVNMATGATLSHIAIWHGKDMLNAFRAFRDRTQQDKHYRAMLKYKEVPMWVYGAILFGSFAIAQATCYTGDAHLPWYGIICAMAVAAVIFPFLTLFPAITGWQVDASTLMLMLGSAVVPGNSQANMYFLLWGGTASTQGMHLAQDLKLAQYTKLPPRTTLWVQSLGTVIGGIVQIALMKEILQNKRDILLDPQGDNIWSGQQVQSFNSQAITWGALAKHMYAPGKTYEMLAFSILVGLLVPVPFYIVHRLYPKLRFNLIVTPLLCYGIGYLNAGINSQNFMGVLTAVGSQYFWRKYRPTSFRKYNFILAAALDAGIQFFVFITTFALFGGTGNAQTMPSWALNPADGYPDYCLYVDGA
ncbi:hypothetical protein JCM10213_001595 [Rhodosporidiobolus nylandii]